MAQQYKITFYDFDKHLQELALTNFEYFFILTEVDKRKAIVFMERVNGKSLQQIANII